MTQMQTQLDNETRNLTEAVEESIKLKAALEQMNTKCIGLESKVRPHLLGIDYYARYEMITNHFMYSVKLWTVKIEV
jgi:hypothetical protein